MPLQPSSKAPFDGNGAVPPSETASVAVVEAGRTAPPGNEGGEPGNQNSADGSALFQSPLGGAVLRDETFSPAHASSVKAAPAFESTLLLQHTSQAMERMRSDGQNHVEVQVRLRDGQEVTIQLRMNAGEFQPVFKTESHELRTALEQNWNQFSSQSADRGMRIAAPVFENSHSGMGNFQQERHPQEAAVFIPVEDGPGATRQRRPAASAQRQAAAAVNESGALSLFA